MRHSILALGCSALLAATPVLADWTLDPERSHLAFVSIKSGDVAEINTFEEVHGVVGEQGDVTVTLMLDSVETLIPIRNERMREMLFETADYREALLEAKVDPEQLAALEVGSMMPLIAEGRLSLHGETQPMTISMQVARLDETTLMVASTKPLIVDAEKFGLSDGVEQLREIAGLERIARAVPVTFVVTFVAQPE
ncbi:YceI family protein [Marichromatium gracile]|uniref:Polyisoprenoid-binding protein YceI n=1 Tax=Marichromatium gracile TaxID=1048 RepID=A0A4R4A6F2_MARGR|nr:MULTISPECIES: YceI family protein [Marichromatium]MBO8084857.1 YceI family protein [Marichromatium sp.]MBK1709683.1 polyisoprenoid-binding protein [Marichromatium gracile]MCF1184259.1 YceI family protein [Marichromatium gracile]RNE93761.1 YceI family protein [Marichromatium sp. AB32]TCW34383.1 polyisoprenoid-binding protein YceI [Marichromatium gracile]